MIAYEKLGNIVCTLHAFTSNMFVHITYTFPDLMRNSKMIPA